MNDHCWPSLLINPPTVPFLTPAPRNISIEITGRCQLDCRHCFNDSGSEGCGDLPLVIVEKLLDQMASWNVDKVRITGGEPTVHDKFFDLIDACRQRGISVWLNSHGVYNTQLLDELKHAPIERFLISIDGVRENHEMIRGRGTFEHALHSCRALKQAGRNVSLTFHVGRENRHDLTALVEIAADIGADFKVSPIRPVGRARTELLDILLTPAQYLEVVRKVIDLRQRYPHISLFTDFDILDDMPSTSNPIPPAKTACHAGRSMVNISHEGDIYPCAFFVTPDKRFSAGNIYRDSLADVWQHSPVFEPFRTQRKSDTCGNCSHYGNRCVGGCPATAYFTAGAIDAHDPMCFAGLLVPLRPARP
uniref:Radical SAM additional 4Fe4S-binding SPASM domain-containing protein n=1 Tax=Candidatus Kentrum sp. MB TaxID=2138164 RepID=A0A450XS63_9GAMM|nr:MAG: radical SAM additional 4Fe4S-binding SPASM domain-containing protein [Candidatus Kentron sp. MB]